MTRDTRDTKPPQRRRAASRSGAADSFARLTTAQQELATLHAKTDSTEASSLETVLTGMVIPRSAAADTLDAPSFTPPTANDPKDQLAYCEAQISNARKRVEEFLAKAERYWRLTAGPALQEIRDKALYKAAGFSSFEEYVDKRWRISRQRAYQLINSVRALKWLEGVTNEVPNERQLRAILPVGDEHGPEAARQVWKLAEERGRTSGAELERAARDLGFLPELGPAQSSEPSRALSVWTRYEPVLRTLSDLRGLRRVAVEMPDRARELAAALRQAAAELEADLPPAEYTDD